MKETHVEENAFIIIPIIIKKNYNRVHYKMETISNLTVTLIKC